MVASISPAHRAKPPILVTGFDAFDGANTNPSWLVAQKLAGSHIAGHAVVAVCLPVVFGRAAEELTRQVRQLRPSVVLCLGLAGGRCAVSFERVAINVDDARIADNAGARPIDTAVVQGGPAAYFSSLPIKAMCSAAQNTGTAAEISQTAGTFVCNHVFYALMHTLANTPDLRHTRGGFVHLPWLPGQGHPHMPLESMVPGLRAALECALATHKDIAHAGGALH